MRSQDISEHFEVADFAKMSNSVVSFSIVYCKVYSITYINKKINKKK